MRKLIAGALIALLIIGIGSFANLSGNGSKVYAATGAAAFIDLSKDHWGYAYVDFAAINGIINGYATGDGRFKFLPENPVSKEEAIVMIYRALGASGKLQSIEDFTSEYQSVMDESRIAAWARKFVAYGLKYNMVSIEELKTFTTAEGLGIPALREQAGVWTAKAIGKNLMPAYTLPYTDVADISAEALPYIELLYRTGIMKGDNQGRFLPDANIKRVEFATIANRIFTAAGTETGDTGKETASYRGNISSVDVPAGKLVLTISGGQNQPLFINSKTRIVKDGKVLYNGLKDLVTGTQVIVGYGAFCRNNLEQSAESGMQIQIQTKPILYKGTISSLKIMDSQNTIIVIQNPEKDMIFYMMNGSTVKMSQLSVGQSVDFICDGVKILEIL